MFPFDQSRLPKLRSRKAFVGVDFQKDFTTESGSLPTTDPPGYVKRAVQLANVFRSCGNTIIWTKSTRGSQLAPNDDRIMATESVSAIPARSRRRATEASPASVGPPDPEAFLSHDEPICLKPDSPGCELDDAVKHTIPASDLVLTKTTYSAFQDTQLLRLLRSNMVMELYICGSLANIGVYATAIDAAGHGLAITIVDDCCGYRSDARQAIAYSRLSDLTGCDIVLSKDVREVLVPGTGDAGQSPESATQTAVSADLSDKLSAMRLEPDIPTQALQSASRSETETNSREELGSQKESKAEMKDPESAQATALSSKGPTRSSMDIKSELQTTDAVTISMPSIEVDNVTDEDGPHEVDMAQRRLCSGDTDVFDNLLPRDLEDGVFEKLKAEVNWQHMSHQGGEVPRLVAVQGEVGDDGSIPVYRHPSDESPPLLPLTPTVRAIKTETEKRLGHPLNHVLIQFYRDGHDYISEHSDKTIDVVKGSYIANVSLGAQRTMVLRTKRQEKGSATAKSSSELEADDSAKASTNKSDETIAEPTRRQTSASLQEAASGHQSPEKTSEEKQKTKSAPGKSQGEAGSSKRLVQRAILQHNSLCRMGLQTNMEWLHSIRQDKRADRDKSAAELAYKGARISLTFRRIGTFLNRDETKIWGQGATGKTKDEAQAVVNGESPEMVSMLKAFGRENHSSTFDWDAHYGKGFDVLHMSNAPRFFACRDALVNMRIVLMLAEYGIRYAKGTTTAPKTCNLDDDQLQAASVKFVDADADKSVVRGDMAIMLYLHACYHTSKEPTDKRPKVDLAKHFSIFQKALAILVRWRRVQKYTSSVSAKVPDLRLLKEELTFWDVSAKGADDKEGFLQGSTPGLADFALWPVIHEIKQVCGADSLDEYAGLAEYHRRFEAREATQTVLRAASEQGRG